MRETLLLVSDYGEIPLKKLIELGEEIFGLSPRTIRNHLDRMVIIWSFRLFGREVSFKVFPVGFYKRRNGERIVYFIGQAPRRLAITYLAASIILFLLGILTILVGDLLGAMQIASMILVLAIGPLTLSVLAYLVRRREGIPSSKVTCIIKYCGKKNIIVKAAFKRNTRLYEVKEYAIREIGKRRGKPLRREYSLNFIDKDGREIKVNETSPLYVLNAETLHFELKEVRTH
ncbi:MAG: hypothetical protein ACTSXC_07590 [Candidatus Freyarchaeota archaeon]